MIWRLIGGVLLLLVLAFGAWGPRAPARAGVATSGEVPAVVIAVPPPAAVTAAPPAAVGAATPVLPNDCAAADAEISRRLQPSLTAGRALPTGMSLGDALASLYKARALCKDGAPESGMLVYIRLADALANAFGERPLRKQ